MIYADHAKAYLEKGYSPLPLPPGKKWPPPEGWTGDVGPMATEKEVHQWMGLDQVDGTDSNIALRLPRGVIAIDVDDYGDHGGAATMQRAVEALGSLKDVTLGKSSARGFTDPSGHRLFRIPEGVKLHASLAQAGFGPGVDIIQFHHRYIVAPPSVHPDGGTYEWHGRTVADFPAVEDLPMLPDAWLEALRIDRDRKDEQFKDLSAASTAEFDGLSDAQKAAVLEYVDEARMKVYEQLEELKDLKLGESGPLGGWDDSVTKLTYRLASLVNAPWTPLTAEEIIPDLSGVLPVDEEFTIGRGLSKFARAIEKGDSSTMPRRIVTLGEIEGGEEADAEWPERSWYQAGHIERTLQMAAGRLLWVPELEAWLERGDDGIWSTPNTPSVDDVAAAWVDRALQRAVIEEAGHYDDVRETDQKGREREGTSQREKFVKALQSATSATHTSVAVAMRRRAADYGIAASLETFDVRPYELATRHGQVIDLRDATWRPLTESDRFTKASPYRYDPDAKAPLWQSFLDLSQPDTATQAYLQEISGYSLTDYNLESVMFVHYGPDAKNGKSTLVDVLLGIAGDHGGAASSKALLKAKGGKDKTGQDAIDLIGYRLLSLSEPPEGAHFDDADVKSFVSGDRRADRAHYKGNTQYRITGKFHVATNHLPHMSGDPGLARRVHIIMWSVVIPEERQIVGFAQMMLEQEGAGILAWAVKGAAQWWGKRDGRQGPVLKQPAELATKTGELIAEDDPVRRWIDERTKPLVGSWTPTGELFEDFRTWCAKQNIAAPSQTTWGRHLARVEGVDRKGRNVGPSKTSGYNLALNVPALTTTIWDDEE